MIIIMLHFKKYDPAIIMIIRMYKKNFKSVIDLLSIQQIINELKTNT